MQTEKPSNPIPETMFLSSRARFLALLLFVVTALVPQAAEIRLKNGDRITGEIIKQEEGRVIIRSELLGELSIPSALLLPEETKPAPTPERPHKEEGGRVAEKSPSEDGGGKHEAELSRFQHFCKNMKATVELGVNSQSGRKDALTISVRGEAEYKRNNNQYQLSGRYLYGEANNTLNTDRREAALRWRRQLQDRLFFQYNTAYLNDRIKGISTDFEQSGGLGYALIKNERHTLNTGAGLTGQYREKSDGTERSSMLGDLFEDYQLKLGKRLTFKQEGRIQFSETDHTSLVSQDGAPTVETVQSSSYKLRFNASLQGRVSDTISLNLRYEYEFDNTISDPGLRADHRVTSSVGYSF